MPRIVTSTGGSVVHMRPLPSDSTTQTVPRLGDTEVGPADRQLRAQELLAQIEARGLGKLTRIVRDLGLGDRAPEEIADLRTVAVDRRDEDVRRPVAVELEDQLGEVGLDRVRRRRPRARR